LPSYVVVTQQDDFALRKLLDNVSAPFFYLQFKFTPKIGHTFTDEREVVVEVPKRLVQRGWDDPLIDEADIRVPPERTRRFANSLLSPKAASTDTQSAVCPRSATMSHGKAKVTHHRTGRQMPNPSLRRPS